MRTCALYSCNHYNLLHINCDNVAFIYLFIYVFIYLFIYLFMYLFIYLCIYLFIYLFIHVFIYLFIYLFICSLNYYLIKFILKQWNLFRALHEACLKRALSILHAW